MKEESRSYRILVVEDDAAFGKLLQRRLNFSGYEALIVPDAVIGIQEAHRFKPDLVVLDLMLPAGGGAQVLKGLKSTVYTANIPVLVISGIPKDFGDEQMGEVQRIGIEGYLQKPFEGKALLSEIQRILSCPDTDGLAEKW